MSDDYSWVAPVMQTAIAMYGENEARKLSDKQLKLLEQQLNDVRNISLPTLEELKAEELGPSAVGSMHSDAALRGNQLRALAELQHMIDSGGLDLTDKASLEEAMTAANNQQKRARAGVAADAAARGQLDSGARLMMDMDAAQSGANAARKTGLETAAMAQRRRLQGIQDAARISGGLREQDWRESESANRAKDIRDERNATARERAAHYNAGLAQQNFTNAMSRATGSQPSAGALASGMGAAAGDARASAAGVAGVVGAAAPAYGGVTRNGGTVSGDSPYTYDTDSNSYGGYKLGADEDDK